MPKDREMTHILQARRGDLAAMALSVVQVAALDEVMVALRRQGLLVPPMVSAHHTSLIAREGEEGLEEGHPMDLAHLMAPLVTMVRHREEAAGDRLEARRPLEDHQEDSIRSWIRA